MNYDSEELWEEGEPAPSMYDQVLDLLKENQDRFFDVGDVSALALDDPRPEQSGPNKPEPIKQLDWAYSLSATKRTEAILERLVYEGVVDKREIAMGDAMDQSAEDHSKDLSEEMTSAMGEADFGGAGTTYYRIARDEV